MAPLSIEETQMIFLSKNAPPIDSMGKSKEIRLTSFMRPWFRAFHFSWLSFFLAFTGWFAFAPVLTTLVEDPSNDITSDVAATSNILSVCFTIFLRLASGPILEKFGPRRVQTSILGIGSILVMLSGLVNSATGLLVMRTLIGGVGAAFVPCQYWTTVMFSKNIVGTANAIVGGWGNLGGGVANLLMGALLEGFGPNGLGLDEYTAWRYCMLVPGILMLLVTIPMFLFTDDSPHGSWKNRNFSGNDANNNSNHPNNYIEESVSGITGQSMHSTVKDDDKKVKQMISMEQIDKKQNNDNEIIKINEKNKEKEDDVDKKISKWDGFNDYRAWLMAIQYGACFGVELAINNSMATYLYTSFTNGDETCIEDETTPALDCSALTKSQAAMVASLFGLMNIFARALGGLLSDFLYKKMGIRGRLLALFVCLVGEGFMLLIFSQITNVGGAIFMLICFSVFVQSSEGATFGIVPFVNKKNIGPIAGIVGAGGNIGAVIWSTIFKQIGLKQGYFVLSFIVLISSFVSFLYPIEGVYMFSGKKTQNNNNNDNDSTSDSESETTNKPIKEVNTLSAV